MAILSTSSIITTARQTIDKTISSAKDGDIESMGWVLVSVLSLLTILIYLIQTFLLPSTSSSSSAEKESSKAALPPVHSVGLPFIGTLLAFAKDPLGLVWEAYHKHGSIFTLKLLHKRLTFVIGPGSISEVFFKASDTELDQNEPYKFSTPVFGKDVVYDAKLPNRLQHFRILSMTLRVNMLEAYIPLMIQEAKAYFNQWGQSGEVDLFQELSDLIILTGSRCIMGKEVRENLFGEVSHLIHDLDQGMQPISVLASWLPTKAHRKRDKARKKMGELFVPIIKARRESGVKHDDMLQWLVDARYRDGSPFADHEIVGNLVAGLFAAQHTSSATSTWIGMHMLRNKDVLERVKQEQRDILGGVDETSGEKKQLDYESLVKMDLLHSCMKEVLRLHPPLIFLMRNVLEPRSAVGGKYKVPKNDFIVTSPSVAGRLPQVYKDPNKFDPDRFLSPREEDKAAPYSFLGFGAGRHGCMGEGFAYIQVKTIWSILLHTFELEAVGEEVPKPNFDALVVGPYHKTCYVKYKRKKKYGV